MESQKADSVEDRGIMTQRMVITARSLRSWQDECLGVSICFVYWSAEFLVWHCRGLFQRQEGRWTKPSTDSSSRTKWWCSRKAQGSRRGPGKGIVGGRPDQFKRLIVKKTVESQRLDLEVRGQVRCGCSWMTWSNRNLPLTSRREKYTLSDCREGYRLVWWGRSNIGAPAKLHYSEYQSRLY